MLIRSLPADGVGLKILEDGSYGSVFKHPREGIILASRCWLFRRRPMKLVLDVEETSVEPTSRTVGIGCHT